MSHLAVWSLFESAMHTICRKLFVCRINMVIWHSESINSGRYNISTIEQAASTTHSEMATIAVQTSERAKRGMQKKGNQHRNSGEKENKSSNILTHHRTPQTYHP